MKSITTSLHLSEQLLNKAWSFKVGEESAIKSTEVYVNTVLLLSYQQREFQRMNCSNMADEVIIICRKIEKLWDFIHFLVISTKNLCQKRHFWSFLDWSKSGLGWLLLLFVQKLLKSFGLLPLFSTSCCQFSVISWLYCCRPYTKRFSWEWAVKL